jgi:hypothetical protein
MAYTQEQVDDLRAAIAGGTLEVESAGRRVKYRSLAEMQAILSTMEQEVATPVVSDYVPQSRTYIEFHRS